MLIDGWMRGLKPGHSESLLIDSPEGVDPAMKMKPIWVTLESDPEEPYKTRQIRCYIASDKEGVSRRQVFGGPSQIVSEIDHEIDKQANPALFDGLKEELDEFSERFGLKLPDLDQINEPTMRQAGDSLIECDRLWTGGKEQECLKIMKRLCREDS